MLTECGQHETHLLHDFRQHITQERFDLTGERSSGRRQTALRGRNNRLDGLAEVLCVDDDLLHVELVLVFREVDLRVATSQSVQHGFGAERLEVGSAVTCK